ncbi:hypothetical protein NL393_31565, partial [Klebsiella pneumoniae]|nr:hypothetical protein [Klebsiella pneumoniae]
RGPFDVKLFKPVLISDNWYWQKAFTGLTISHRIDAKETATMAKCPAYFSSRLNILSSPRSYFHPVRPI